MAKEKKAKDQRSATESDTGVAHGGGIESDQSDRGSREQNSGSAFDAGEGGFDGDSQLGGTRREPGR